MLEFTGDEWYGEKKGWGNYVTLKSVKLVKKGRYSDLWRAKLLVRTCDRADGNPRALPQQLVMGTTLDTWVHDYWLDLADWGSRCLEVGPVLWQGEFTGVNILRWLSVEDAAWCRPVPCPPRKDCEGCSDCDCEQEVVACDCER
jgi:hypothetical protein